jgi:hypothetical protein
LSDIVEVSVIAAIAAVDIAEMGLAVVAIRIPLLQHDIIHS